MRKFMKAKGYEDHELNLPVRGTKASAGYDFFTLDAADIAPQEVVSLRTGIKAQMEEDEVLLLFPRSSLAIKHSLRLANTIGVIDADYCGNAENDGQISIVVYNFSQHLQHVEKGERIAQGIFIKYLRTDDDDVDKKRNGGFGSTGRL